MFVYCLQLCIQPYEFTSESTRDLVVSLSKHLCHHGTWSGAINFLPFFICFLDRSKNIFFSVVKSVAFVRGAAKHFWRKTFCSDKRIASRTTPSSRDVSSVWRNRFNVKLERWFYVQETSAILYVFMEIACFILKPGFMWWILTIFNSVS